MALSRLVFIFLTICGAQLVASSNNVPIFMWGDLERVSQRANPLTEVSKVELNSILKEELNNEPYTVIFIEENLSVEDFARKNSNGKTSYPYLHANIAASLYLPATEDSVEVIKSHANPDKVDEIVLTENGLSTEIQPGVGRYLFVNLEDAREGESREDMLLRHNNFMEKLFNQLQANNNRVVGIYTALNPSWTVVESHSRVRREIVDDSLVYNTTGLLLYTVNMMVDSQQLSGYTNHVYSLENNTIIEKLQFSNAAAYFYINFMGGYWFLNTVVIEKDGANKTYANNEVYAVDGFSYRCSQFVHFQDIDSTNPPSVFTIENMQIQPALNGSLQNFGDPFYCVGFTSVPIWSGLMVVFIMLLITFYGIMMMMDIRTMDRFDDPKGKTISINAVE